MRTAKTPLVRLNYSEKDHITLIEPKDNDRYMMTVEDVIEACGMYQKEERAECRRQFETLKNAIGGWIHKRRKLVHRSFLTIRDAGLLLLIVTESKVHDASFDNELTELDLQIAHDKEFSLIPLSVLALPRCSEAGFESFCGGKAVLEYKG